MDILNTSILAFASILNLLLGFLAYFKNPKNYSNVLFLMLTLSLVGWTVSNYIALNIEDPDRILFLVETLMFFVVLQNTIYFLFINYFPDGKFKVKKLKILYYIYFLIAFLATVSAITGLFFNGYENSDSSITPLPTPFLLLFSLHAALSIIGSFTILIYRRKKASGKFKNQLSFLILASIVLFVIVPLTNFILPNVFRVNIFAPYGTVYASIFALIIAYTIFAHKLFDIRSFVARTVAYAGSITLLVTLYTQATLQFTGVTLFSADITTEQQIVNLALAIGAAILFKPLKKVFDKLTNRIFYRDAYDTQVLVDELNNVLVNTPDLSNILENSAKIIKNTMKISSCSIMIRDTAYFPSRSFGDKVKNEDLDIDKLSSLSKTIKKSVFNAGSERDDARNSNLDKLLHKHNFDVLVRLVDNPKMDVSGVGYILLGPKSSGSVYSNQDIKILEIIANELVIAVENALRLEEIEQFNVTLQNKIDGATKELKQSNKKLRVLDEAKDEFVSMASHQLRTPLTSIKGYLSMVLEGDAGKINSEQRKMLGQAFFSAQRMVYLIADLLNVSRLKTGKFVIEEKNVYLPKVVDSEVSQLREGLAAKNLELEFKKPKEFTKVRLDEMKIRQVIMNFLDNSIYYTPKDGKVTVELKEDSKNVELTIQDTGIGVPIKEQSKLFSKFYRADNAKKLRPDGTGLGLFMAKKVIEAHSGEVIFESKEDSGSKFGFKIPIKKVGS